MDGGAWMCVELAGRTLPDHIRAGVIQSAGGADIRAAQAPFTGGGGLAAGGDLDVLSEQFVSALARRLRHYIFQPFQEDLRVISASRSLR